MREIILEWRDRWNNGDVKFVTDLFELVEELEIHERNLESALKEVIELVRKHNEELAYDCSRIVDKWSWT